MRNLIRPELRDIKPYTVSSRLKGTWLNANESPWESNLNRYPSKVPSRLMTQLAEIYQVRASQLLLTRGSDEGIDILVRLFCRPYQDAIMIFPPTFSMYQQSARLQAATCIEVPLCIENNYQLDFAKITKSLTPETKIISVCSPNNPTGNLIPVDDMMKLLNMVNEKAIVMIDEAYIEFAEQRSMTQVINQWPNLVVLRTLSKAYGLAGLRCGVVIAQAPLIEKLRLMLPPYPFSNLTLETLLQATSAKSRQRMLDNIHYLNEQKRIMAQALGKFDFVKKIYTSDANFLLIQVNNTQFILKYFEENGIYVRDLSSEKGLRDCFRLTIGLAEQNQQVLAVLQKIKELS